MAFILDAAQLQNARRDIICNEQSSDTLFCFGFLGPNGSGKTTTLLTPVILAIYMPWDAGPRWVEGPPSLLIAALIPIILVGIAIPDSFAGERERHTLGTLLASRLPDRAVLLGKIAVAVGFAWGMTLIVLLLGLATVNVAHWEGELLVYTPTIALADIALSLLMATLVANAGVLISLRAATVQEAAQTLIAVFFVPFMLLGIVLLVIRDQAREFLGSLDLTQILLIVIAVLVVANVGLFAAAMARFRRARLILG